MTQGTVSQALITDIVQRIVDAVHPDKIILFGSAARDQLGPNSDLDILVVKDVLVSRWRETDRGFAARHFACQRRILSEARGSR